jgi:hypothetical protein
MDDTKLKFAIEVLLTKYPTQTAAIYLNAFNDMNEARFSETRLLKLN